MATLGIPQKNNTMPQRWPERFGGKHGRRARIVAEKEDGKYKSYEAKPQDMTADECYGTAKDVCF